MDLSKLEENILSLEDYPVEKWNPKICEGVEFEINSDAEWFYNGSKIERIKMVQLFSKLIKYEKGKYFVVTPSEKILVKVKKEIFLITDYKFEENFIMFKTNTDEWIKLTKNNPLSVPMVDNQPYPKIKLKDNVWGLLSRNVFYKLISDANQDGNRLYLESDNNYFYLN